MLLRIRSGQAALEGANHGSLHSTRRLSAVFERVRFAVEYALFRALVALVEALPMDTAIRTAGALSQVFAIFSSRRGRAARHLREAMPELDARTRSRILRGMWRNLGMTFVETILIDKIALQPERIALDDAALEALRLANEEGVVFVCPHIGNWEASVLPVAAARIRHAAVYLRAKNPLFDAELFRRRRKYYPAGLHERGPEAAKALARNLRDGGSIGVMADLRDELDECRVPFFGRDAPSTTFPAMLARRFDRPLVADCLLRVGPGRFQMKIERLSVPRTSDRRADIRTATAGIQSCFERWIRQHPEQWLWAHRRYER